MSNIGTATSGKVLQAQGTGSSPKYSTATYPSTAGTSKNIIQSDGTNFLSVSPGTAGSSLVLISSQNVTASASVSFTGLSSTYAPYLLNIAGLSATAGNPDLHLDFSTDNGSTYVNSGLATGINTNVYNSTAVTNNNSTTTGIIGVSVPNNSTYNATIYLNNPGFVASTWYYGNIAYYNGTSILAGSVFGTTGGTTLVNAVKVSVTSSTIASARVSLYGYALS